MRAQKEIWQENGRNNMRTGRGHKKLAGARQWSEKNSMV
jgi:hypothetical protein